MPGLLGANGQFVNFLGLVQVYLELFMDLMDLAHPVSGLGIGGVDRYDWVRTTQTLPVGDMISTLVRNAACHRRHHQLF